jgi:hypothetical protein
MRINKTEIAVGIIIIGFLVLLTVYKCLSVLEQSKEIATKKGLSSLETLLLYITVITMGCILIATSLKSLWKKDT